MSNVNKPETCTPTNIAPQAHQCVPQETVIKDVRLAAAYVPFQKLCTIFRPIEALKAGTAFPELYSPYMKPDKKLKKDMGMNK